MSFEVLLHPQAAKFFRKLPLEEQNRVKSRLNELRKPFKIPSVKLKGRKSVYRPSDDLNQAGDDLDWVDVPMTVQATNETDQVVLYMATVDLPPVNSNNDIIYRISTEDEAGNINPAAFDIRDYPQCIHDQRFIYQPPGLPEWVLLVAVLAVFVSLVVSIVYVKFLTK